ncbi:CobQ/CobB/MinD/ParA nucleotide binding domain protein [uncultured delta proteobacterium]|uniref:CobQ/CobB/MinD/ParA nucleotide binding domain protein n=1 Tax=uncultured delta proteobacterium TaxID=34034 RepID=A0A212J093_9DELT|nr:CobQ/CobB/MinD/ParA nucleotide binding domain protein [uncultured delta proteobacterium]
MDGTQKSRNARVLAVANQKGGVGKTTTAVTLSAALARAGYTVLIIDLDPHACASVHLRFYPDDVHGTVNEIFTSEEKDWAAIWPKIRYRHEGQSFDVTPGSIRLSELETDLRGRKGKGAILQQALTHIRNEYDYIVIDCPPHVGILLVNALVACDLLVIPIQTDFLALHGLKLLFDSIRILNRVLPNPIAYRALATMYDRRARACNRVLELLDLKMDNRMFRTVIGVDTRFRDASALGKVIYEIDPESRGAKEYEELAREIVAL